MNLKMPNRFRLPHFSISTSYCKFSFFFSFFYVRIVNRYSHLFILAIFNSQFSIFNFFVKFSNLCLWHTCSKQNCTHFTSKLLSRAKPISIKTGRIKLCTQPPKRHRILFFIFEAKIFAFPGLTFTRQSYHSASLSHFHCSSMTK